MNLTSKEQENQISSHILSLDFEKYLEEIVWIMIDNSKWQYYIKNLGEKFVKFFSLEEILEIEKDFVVKKVKEKSNL